MTDNDRHPVQPAPSTTLDPDRVQVLAQRRGLLWGPFTVLASTGSTNADLAGLAAQGAPSGTVVVAGEQTAGRGRQGRAWESPAGTSISASVLVRLTEPSRASAGWLPLIVGLGVRAGLAEAIEDPIALKWPNDILIEGGPRPGKVAGILAEAVPAVAGGRAGLDSAVVIGFGVNVAQAEAELPVPEATSLRLAGAADVDHSLLVVRCLAGIERYLQPWLASGADADRSGTMRAYRAASATIGQRVRVAMPGGHELIGVARDIDTDGHLLLVDDEGEHVVAAGDVVHLRRH